MNKDSVVKFLRKGGSFIFIIIIAIVLYFAFIKPRIGENHKTPDNPDTSIITDRYIPLTDEEIIDNLESRVAELEDELYSKEGDLEQLQSEYDDLSYEYEVLLADYNNCCY